MPSRKGVYWFTLCQEVWEHISLLSYQKWALSFDNLIGILICIFISNEVEICDTHISLLMNYLFLSLVPFTFHFIAIRLTTLPLYPYHITDTSDRSSLNILIAKCQRHLDEFLALNPVDYFLPEALSSLDFHNTSFTSFYAFFSGTSFSAFFAGSYSFTHHNCWATQVL